MGTKDYTKMHKQAEGVPSDATLKQIKRMMLERCSKLKQEDISALSKRLATKDTTVGDFFLSILMYKKYDKVRVDEKWTEIADLPVEGGLRGFIKYLYTVGRN